MSPYLQHIDTVAMQAMPLVVVIENDICTVWRQTKPAWQAESDHLCLAEAFAYIRGRTFADYRNRPARDVQILVLDGPFLARYSYADQMLQPRPAMSRPVEDLMRMISEVHSGNADEARAIAEIVLGSKPGALVGRRNP